MSRSLSISLSLIIPFLAKLESRIKMARIRVPQKFPETYFLAFCIITICYPSNATLLTSSTKTEVSYENVGCFEVWHRQFTKLYSKSYDPLNSLSSCAEKCLETSSKTQLVFLRGMECRCAPDSLLNASKAEDGNVICNYPCPGAEETSESDFKCGGNMAYSVSCVSPLPHTYECRNLIGVTKTTIVSSIGPTIAKAPEDFPYPHPRVDCGLCPKSPVDLCAPENLSPYFDYFALNSPKECAVFCHKKISYAVWDVDFDEALLMDRGPSLYAILVWWRIPGYPSVTLPICLCGDDNVKKQFTPDTPEHCRDMECQEKPGESCGGFVEETDSIYGSVYCIEDGSMSCTASYTPPIGSTSTIASTGEGDPVVTDESSTTTAISTTTIKTSTTVGSTTADTSPPDCLKPVPDPSTSKPSTSGSIWTTTTPLPLSSKKCSRRDRHGILWEIGVNKQAFKKCSVLIPNSTGTAVWKCNAWGKFETRQPNVTQCRSKWVNEMGEKFLNVEDLGDAYDYTGSLFAGCGDHSGNKEYFGHEMFELVANTTTTLRNAKTFDSSPSEGQFTVLVNDAVHLSACLIVTSPEPWEDLSMKNKSHLYTHILEATDDALFQLTQYVKSKLDYRKEFTPMTQFTAAAEAFENLANASKKYPPQCAPDGKSCIRLPHGWTDNIRQSKVHIVVITMAPQSVATAMTGIGIYEVNGEKNKMLNGRIMSLSVTSSSPESKSLQFHGKGVVTTFRHITDAHGEEPYEIRRKLHDGEIPKAVLGGSQCVFWDTKKNMWSGKGCHLVKSGRTETTCECSHLTAFSILMKVHSYTGKQRGLEILTFVLCPLSELGLLLTIIILFRTKSYSCKIRSTICKHLSFCLLLGNGMILTVLDRHNFRLSPGACIGAAIAGHYILLCAFMWMLLEGVQLYRAVVHVFESGKSYAKHFGVVAYGAPLIIVGITAISGYVNKELPYGGDPYCWLIGNYIWLFMAPVAVVITINLIILFIALKTAYQLQDQHHQNSQQRDKTICPVFIMDKFRCYRVIFKGCFTLTVILGLTWIVGFFTMVEGPCGDVAAYLFTILNASQGLFIFRFNCRNYISKLGSVSSCFPFPSIRSINSSTTNQSSPAIQKPSFISFRKKFVLPNSNNNKLQS